MRIARYKAPKSVELVTALPNTFRKDLEAGAAEKVLGKVWTERFNLILQNTSSSNFLGLQILINGKSFFEWAKDEPEDVSDGGRSL
jgi:hypothetical protein